MAATEQSPLIYQEFTRYRDERIRIHAARVRDLTHEFNKVKDELIAAKKELKRWQGFTFERYVMMQ